MDPHIQFDNVTVVYGSHVALRDISMDVPRHSIFGIIGPANSGKTTLLKCINRTIDFVPSARVQGQVLVGGDQAVGYGHIYEAMVLLQKAGVAKVGLMSDPLESIEGG